MTAINSLRTSLMAFAMFNANFNNNHQSSIINVYC